MGMTGELNENSRVTAGAVGGTEASAHSDAPCITLAQLPPMRVGVVERIDAVNADAVRLKRLGICEGRLVQMVRADDPLIVRVVGTRIGISAQLAPLIHVRPCEGCDHH